MNRIQRYAEALCSSKSSFSALLEPPSDRSRQRDAACAVFTPLHYEPNYAYPLVLWLHGAGDDERQLRRVMPLVSLRNYVAVSPRGTATVGQDLDDVLSGQTTRGYRWRQTDDHILLAEQRILHALQLARERFNVARQRIFVAGVGCGGTMAFRFAFDHPRLVAGVLSLGGAFPTGGNPLGQLPSARRLQLLIASGRDSKSYPPDLVCENLRLFHSAGMAVNLRQYPCGDELTTQMLSDMDRWMMEQLGSSTAAAEECRRSAE